MTRPVDYATKEETRDAILDVIYTFVKPSLREDMWVGASADVAAADALLRVTEYLFTDKGNLE